MNYMLSLILNWRFTWHLCLAQFLVGVTVGSSRKEIGYKFAYQLQFSARIQTLYGKKFCDKSSGYGRIGGLASTLHLPLQGRASNNKKSLSKWFFNYMIYQSKKFS